MSEPAAPTAVCVFCGGDSERAVELPRFEAHACLGCTVRVGKLVATASPVLFELWPMLREDEAEELEPEPKVRRGDGTTVELREVTAELKRELPPEKRVELAETYGGLGMWREQILECAEVMVSDAPQAVLQQAVNLLFARALYRGKDFDLLRGRMYPA